MPRKGGVRRICGVPLSGAVSELLTQEDWCRDEAAARMDVVVSSPIPSGETLYKTLGTAGTNLQFADALS